MCISPLNIDISKRQMVYNPNGFFPSVVSVPCGNCPECLSSSQNSYFVRLVAEYNDCVNNGGLVVFLTFTYSDDNVPYVFYGFEDDSFSYFAGRGRFPDKSCLFRFCKSDLQTFFNSFRKRFERLGISEPFRYFVCGEYGTDFAHTQRPHYHALLYLSPDVVSHYDSFSFLGCNQFMSDVSSLWSYGIVSESKEHGLVVKSSDCCSYVSKYVGKSLDLLNLRRFRQFHEFISDNFDKFDIPDFPYLPSVDSYFKYFLRVFSSRLFVLKSKNFGLSLIHDFDNCTPADVYLKLDAGISYSSLHDGRSFRYSYPKYIVNKLLYNYTVDGYRILSPRGYSIKRHLMRSLISSQVNECLKLDLVNYQYFRSDEMLSLVDFSRCLRDTSFMLRYYLYLYFVRGRVFNRSYASIVTRYVCSNTIMDFSERFDFLFRCCYGFHVCFEEEYYVYSQCSSDYYLTNSQKFCLPYFNSFFESFHNSFTSYMSYLKRQGVFDKALAHQRIRELRDILSIYN